MKNIWIPFNNPILLIHLVLSKHIDCCEFALFSDLIGLRFWVNFPFHHGRGLYIQIFKILKIRFCWEGWFIHQGWGAGEYFHIRYKNRDIVSLYKKGNPPK